MCEAHHKRLVGQRSTGVQAQLALAASRRKVSAFVIPVEEEQLGQLEYEVALIPEQKVSRSAQERAVSGLVGPAESLKHLTMLEPPERE